MTKAERKRVNFLSNVLKKCCGTGDGNIIRIIAFIGVLLLDAALFIAAGADDELYMMLPFHVFIAAMFIGFLPTMTTTLIGDMQSLFQVNNTAMLFGGSVKSGDFLSTLPFEAKDVIAFKLSGFEKQLVLSTASIIIIEIMLMLADNAGYAVHSGIGSLGVIAYLIIQVMFMLLVFARKAVTSFAITAVGVLAIVVPCFSLAAFSEDHEKSAEIGKLIESIGFLSEIPGMIILAVLTVAIIAMGRAILKSKHGVSWNLR